MTFLVQTLWSWQTIVFCFSVVFLVHLNKKKDSFAIIFFSSLIEIFVFAIFPSLFVLFYTLSLLIMTDFVSATKKIIKKRTLIRKRITIRINLLKNDESMNPIAFKKHEAEIDSFLTEIRALNSQIEDVCNTLDLDVEEELEKDITQECEFSIRIFNDLAILASNSEPEAKWLPDSKPTRSQSCENNEPSILRHYSVWTSKPITSKANNGKAELKKTSSKSEFQSAPKINKKKQGNETL